MVVTEKDCNGVEKTSDGLSVDNDTNGVDLCSMRSQDEGAVVDSGVNEGEPARAGVDGSQVNKDDLGPTGLEPDKNNSTLKNIASELVRSEEEGQAYRVEGIDEGGLGTSTSDGIAKHETRVEEASNAAREEEIEDCHTVDWNVPVDLESGIVVFVTSCPGNAKVKSDTRRVLHLLNVKKAEYKTVDLANNGALRIHMLERSDLNITIPQVHVNGVFIGTAEDLQESEDYGELEDLLRGVDPEIVKENTRVKVQQRIEAIEIEESKLGGEEDLSGTIVKEIRGDTRIEEKLQTDQQLEEDDLSELGCDCYPSKKGRVERKLANHDMYFEEEKTGNIGSGVGIIKSKKE